MFLLFDEVDADTDTRSGYVWTLTFQAPEVGIILAMEYGRRIMIPLSVLCS